MAAERSVKDNAIFISYRRSDSQDLAGRLYDRLADQFGPTAVFQDVDSMPYGVDFQAHLNQTVGNAQVVLAIIGPTWLPTLLDRVQKSDIDWVRLELETAIAQGITIIPVRAGGVDMPKTDQLPKSLRTLASFHSAQARPNPDFGRDMDRLIHRLQEIIEPEILVSGQCKDRVALQQYLSAATKRLQQAGSLDIRQKAAFNSSLNFNRVAKILDFEPGLGMRGEALFIFAEFASLNFSQFQQFSSQALTWARADVNPKSAGQAFYNFRVPTHLCFAVAVVDSLDDKTRDAIRTANPIKRRADLLWYELPVVFELAEGDLCYYDAAATFLENFRGELPLQKIRQVARELLSPHTRKL